MNMNINMDIKKRINYLLKKYAYIDSNDIKIAQKQTFIDDYFDPLQPSPHHLYV